MPTILSNNKKNVYRGRIAPSPSGLLHLGHARTFYIAQTRAREANGDLVLRIEDIDGQRSRKEFTAAAIEDLSWFGLRWQEGPDKGGNFGPYLQSQRLDSYRAALTLLQKNGTVYPCYCSRKDIAHALTAPHEDSDEAIYPGTCRPAKLSLETPLPATPVTWRFRVPDGESIRFQDQALGDQEFICGRDFGDFPVWRKDDLPSYQLAVTVDDAAMQISEVVRGRDLIISTARQLLLYHALDLVPPLFYHCELVNDANGQRLAKRNTALTLQKLRATGHNPADLRNTWQAVYSR